MGSIQRIGTAAGLGGALALLIAGTLQQPLMHALTESHHGQELRLLQGAEPLLRSALTRNDDLAQIDEIRRLRKLSDVVNVIQAADGGISIKLSRHRLRQTRLEMWQRTGLFVMVCALGGGLIEAWRQRMTRKKWNQLRRHGRRRRTRLRAHQKRLCDDLRHDLLAWIRQALAFSDQALVLLDGQQRVVAVNSRAQKAFNLPVNALGRHWLELYSSPEWAVALRQSLAYPAQRTSAPPPAHAAEVSLLTFTPGATWIIVVV
jgi:PAS domain-containing protein